MTTLTFRDFTFRAHHCLLNKHGAAAHPHWHTYTARFWFEDAPDQDYLSQMIEKRFVRLHGAALNLIVEPESSDEALAQWFIEQLSQSVDGIDVNCVKVRVTNDGQRGAEVTK